MDYVEMMNAILSLEDGTVLEVTFKEDTECIPFEECNPSEWGF